MFLTEETVNPSVATAAATIGTTSMMVAVCVALFQHARHVRVGTLA